MAMYLDNAATTKPKQEVIEAMIPYFTNKWHNPSSLYSDAVKVKKDIEDARKTVANFINANANEIYFTSSGSESNCWAIRGFVDYSISKGRKPCVITSTIEHKSIIECVDHLNNVEVHYIGVDKYGFVNLANLRSMMLQARVTCDDIVVSIQFANNEIGTIQRIEDIADVVHRYDGVFHTDAVQAVGNVHIDVEALGVDMLTASGHKMGCPKGCGFLYKKNNVNINPLIYGTQMDGLRGGTENTAYIMGMAKAIELCDTNFSNIEELYSKTDYFIGYLKYKFNAKLNGHPVKRLPNNVNVTFPQNITAEALLYSLDLSNIQVSVGSACNSHSIEPSHVLKAIGLSDEEAMKTIRITINNDITYEDIDYVVEELDKAIKIISI